MRVSFVVPTRDSARTLRSCLESLRAQSYADVEVIVVDNGSSDATPRIAAELAHVVLDHGPERSAQRNAGAAAASGEMVVFIDSDMVLEPSLAREVVERFAEQPAAGALVLPERSFGDGFWAGCKALEKSLYVGDAGVEAPRAFRRSVLDAVGGWDETLTSAEDWELADRVRAGGHGIGRVQAWIWHDEGRLQLRGTVAKKRYYGRWMGDYLSRGRASGGHLRRTSLLSQPRRLAAQPVLAAGMITLKLAEATGMVLGMLSARLRPLGGA